MTGITTVLITITLFTIALQFPFVTYPQSSPSLAAEAPANTTLHSVEAYRVDGCC